MAGRRDQHLLLGHHDDASDEELERMDEDERMPLAQAAAGDDIDDDDGIVKDQQAKEEAERQQTAQRAEEHAAVNKAPPLGVRIVDPTAIGCGAADDGLDEVNSTNRLALFRGQVQDALRNEWSAYSLWDVAPTRTAGARAAAAAERTIAALMGAGNGGAFDAPPALGTSSVVVRPAASRTRDVGFVEGEETLNYTLTPGAAGTMSGAPAGHEDDDDDEGVLAASPNATWRATVEAGAPVPTVVAASAADSEGSEPPLPLSSQAPPGVSIYNPFVKAILNEKQRDELRRRVLQTLGYAQRSAARGLVISALGTGAEAEAEALTACLLPPPFARPSEANLLLRAPTDPGMIDRAYLCGLVSQLEFPAAVPTIKPPTTDPKLAPDETTSDTPPPAHRDPHQSESLHRREEQSDDDEGRHHDPEVSFDVYGCYVSAGDGLEILTEAIVAMPTSVAIQLGMGYTGVHRSAARRLCQILGVSFADVVLGHERRLCSAMMVAINNPVTSEESAAAVASLDRNKTSKKVVRGLKVGAFAVAGGALCVVTGGIAAVALAPALVGLAGAIGGATAAVSSAIAGLLGTGAFAAALISIVAVVGQATVIVLLVAPLVTTATFSTVFGVSGATLAGYKANLRVGGLTHFRLRYISARDGERPDGGDGAESVGAASTATRSRRGSVAVKPRRPAESSSSRRSESASPTTRSRAGSTVSGRGGARGSSPTSTRDAPRAGCASLAHGTADDTGNDAEKRRGVGKFIATVTREKRTVAGATVAVREVPTAHVNLVAETPYNRVLAVALVNRIAEHVALAAIRTRASEIPKPPPIALRVVQRVTLTGSCRFAPPSRVHPGSAGLCVFHNRPRFPTGAEAVLILRPVLEGTDDSPLLPDHDVWLYTAVSFAGNFSVALRLFPRLLATTSVGSPSASRQQQHPASPTQSVAEELPPSCGGFDEGADWEGASSSAETEDDGGDDDFGGDCEAGERTKKKKKKKTDDTPVMRVDVEATGDATANIADERAASAVSPAMLRRLTAGRIEELRAVASGSSAEWRNRQVVLTATPGQLTRVTLRLTADELAEHEATAFDAGHRGPVEAMDEATALLKRKDTQKLRRKMAVVIRFGAEGEEGDAADEDDEEGRDEAGVEPEEEDPTIISMAPTSFTLDALHLEHAQLLEALGQPGGAKGDRHATWPSDRVPREVPRDRAVVVPFRDERTSLLVPSVRGAVVAMRLRHKTLTNATGRLSHERNRALFLVAGLTTTNSVEACAVFAPDDSHLTSVVHKIPRTSPPLSTDERQLTKQEPVHDHQSVPRSSAFSVRPILHRTEDGPVLVFQVIDERRERRREARRRMALSIGISGFSLFFNAGRTIPEQQAESWRDALRSWRSGTGGTERYVLEWEPDQLHAFGQFLDGDVFDAAEKAGVKMATDAALQAAAAAAAAVVGAFTLPEKALQAIGCIDNAFAVLSNRSVAAGQELAAALCTERVGRRPVTLIGYSFGGVVALECAKKLAALGKAAILESVVVLGGTALVSSNTWRVLRSAIPGRIVNVYVRSDFVLSALLRANNLTRAARAIAGLGPVVGVPGIENVDASSIVRSHMDYATKLRDVLELIPEVPSIASLAPTGHNPGLVVPLADGPDAVTELAKAAAPSAIISSVLRSRQQHAAGVVSVGFLRPTAMALLAANVAVPSKAADRYLAAVSCELLTDRVLTGRRCWLYSPPTAIGAGRLAAFAAHGEGPLSSGDDGTAGDGYDDAGQQISLAAFAAYAVSAPAQFEAARKLKAARRRATKVVAGDDKGRDTEEREDSLLEREAAVLLVWVGGVVTAAGPVLRCSAQLLPDTTDLTWLGSLDAEQVVRLSQVSPGSSVDPVLKVRIVDGIEARPDSDAPGVGLIRQIFLEPSLPRA